MVPVPPAISGITFVCTFHIGCISIVGSLYCRIISAPFLITFLFPENALSVNRHLPFSLQLIMKSDLFVRMVLPFFSCSCHNMFSAATWVVSTNFCTWPYWCSLSKFDPCFLTQVTRVGTLIVATIYLQLIQNRYKFRCFTVL